MSVSILVTESQIIVALTLLLIVGGIVVARVGIGWLVATVAAAVVVAASTQEVPKTKKPGPSIILVRSLSLPPATVASAAVSSTKEGAKEPCVCLPVLRLSLASAAGVVLAVAASIEGSTENSAAKESSTHTEEAPVNKLVTGAYYPLVSVQLGVPISVGCRGRG